MIPAKDRDLSLFTKEYAKELFEAQGNIICKDISRKPKAPQDLICNGECSWKIENKLILSQGAQNHNSVLEAKL